MIAASPKRRYDVRALNAHACILRRLPPSPSPPPRKKKMVWHYPAFSPIQTFVQQMHSCKVDQVAAGRAAEEGGGERRRRLPFSSSPSPPKPLPKALERRARSDDRPPRPFPPLERLLVEPAESPGVERPPLHLLGRSLDVKEASVQPVHSVRRGRASIIPFFRPP